MTAPSDVFDLPPVRLKPKADARAIRHGFPWVYGNDLVIDRRTKALPPGAVTVLEELEKGNAFLVEFNERKAAENCDWLGVLYTTEIEFENGAPRA